MSVLYYLQDKRSYVGNDMLFWAIDGKGYTTDLNNAHAFTEDEAMRQHQCRPDIDIPWPKDYIDGKIRPAVDMQYVDIDIALQQSGIKLVKLSKPKADTYKCYGCGKFMSRHDFYSGVCPHCDCVNEH